MKKKILSSLILTFMLAGLTACGGNTDTPETAPTSSETAEQTEAVTSEETAPEASEETEASAETSAETEPAADWKTDTDCPRALLDENFEGFPAYDEAEGTNEEKDRDTLNFWLFYMKMLQSDTYSGIEKWHLVFADADNDGYYDMIFRPYYDTVVNTASMYDTADTNGVQVLLNHQSVLFAAGDNYSFNYNADRSAVLNLTDNEKTSELAVIGYSNNPYDENGYAIQISDPSLYLPNAPMVYYYSDDCTIPEDERIYSAPFDSEEFAEKYGLDTSLIKENDTDEYGAYLATAEFAAEYEKLADDLKAKYSDNPVLEGVFTADEIASMHVDEFIERLRG